MSDDKILATFDDNELTDRLQKLRGRSLELRGRL
jgi:hypothetical protein